jgi:hypothetical protein
MNHSTVNKHSVRNYLNADNGTASQPASYTGTVEGNPETALLTETFLSHAKVAT